jgi:hypothetical protein
MASVAHIVFWGWMLNYFFQWEFLLMILNLFFLVGICFAVGNFMLLFGSSLPCWRFLLSVEIFCLPMPTSHGTSSDAGVKS